MKRTVLALALVVVWSMVLVGCYHVGHQTHSEEDHAKLMYDMNNPEVPSQHDLYIP